RDLGAGLLKFRQPVGVLFNLLQGRFLAVNGGEKALDNYRALAAEEEDVRQNLFERNRGAVDPVDVSLGTAVQLSPDLVAAREMLEPMLNVGKVQSGRIRQQHELEEGESAQRADMHHRLERVGELGRKGRLTIAAEGYVTHLEQFIRQRAIPGPLAQAPAAHEG